MLIKEELDFLETIQKRAVGVIYFDDSDYPSHLVKAKLSILSQRGQNNS